MVLQSKSGPKMFNMVLNGLQCSQMVLKGLNTDHKFNWIAFITSFNLVLVWSKIVQILTNKSSKWVRHNQVSWSSFCLFHLEEWKAFIICPKHNFSYLSWSAMTDILNVTNFTLTWFQVKKNFCQKLRKFCQNWNCHKLPQNYTLNTLIKLQKKCIYLFALHFLELFHKKCNKKENLQQNTFLFRASNLHQPKKWYTNNVCDT